MSRSLARVWPLLVVSALLAVPASADVFYVTLTNGTVVETARQPQQASWDPNMVLLLTEVGNWVGFPKDEVQSVRAEDPTQGFGIRISDKAIALGRAPNDLPDETKTRQDLINDRYLDYANRMLDLQEQRQNYSIQQFVDPGSASNGIPVSYGLGGFSGLGGFNGGNFGGGLGGGFNGNTNTPTTTDGASVGAPINGLSGVNTTGAPPQ